MTQTTGAAPIQAFTMYGSNNRLLSSLVACQGRNGETGGYDDSGNVLCSGSYSTMEQKQFVWDADNRMTQFWNQQHNNPYLAALYTYDATGQRVRSDNPTAGTWREYSYFNGQMLAEKDNTGAWTDHIYANRRRIAKVDASRPVLRALGSYSQQGCVTNLVQSGLGGYQYYIKSGDRLMIDQRNNAAVGGLLIVPFNAGFITNQLSDTTGAPMNGLGDTGGAWIHRSIDLSSFVGTQINGFWPTTSSGTPAGSWEMSFSDISIMGADGTVTPVFWGQAIASNMQQSCSGASSSLVSDRISGTIGGVTTATLTVTFPNDACTCLGNASSGDRNLYITSILANNQPLDLSLATYTACHTDSTLFCAGSLTIPIPAGSSITVNAYGSPADVIYPHMLVAINGVTRLETDVDGNGGSYAVNSSAPSSLLTTYFASDHLGTAQMEFSGLGTPRWKGEFAPFGQELAGMAPYGQEAGGANPIAGATLSENRYKFTAKNGIQNRDWIISGLDTTQAA